MLPGKGNATLVQLHAERLFVHGFEKAGAERAMHVNRRPDHLPRPSIGPIRFVSIPCHTHLFFISFSLFASFALFAVQSFSTPLLSVGRSVRGPHSFQEPS